MVEFRVQCKTCEEVHVIRLGGDEFRRAVEGHLFIRVARVMALVIVAVVVAFFGNCYHERIVPGADESEVERIMRRAKEDPTMGVEVFIKSDSDTYRVFRPVNGNEVEKSE